MTNKFTTVSEVATKLGINKSQLIYWAHEKLLTPVQHIGRTMIFEETTLMEEINFVREQKKIGKTVKEIKELKLK